MRWRYVLRSIGALIFCLGVTLLLPMAFAAAYRDNRLPALVKTLMIALASGTGLYVIFRSGHVSVVTHREGMAIVALGWIGAGVVGGPCPSCSPTHSIRLWMPFSNRFRASRPQEPLSSRISSGSHVGSSCGGA